MDQIETILMSSGYPLSEREIAAKCRIQGLRVNISQILAILAEMQKEGRIVLRQGRWNLVNKVSSSSKVSESVTGPQISETTLKILQAPKSKVQSSQFGQDVSTPNYCDISNELAKTDVESASSEIGPWSTFRSLLRYYINCLQAEEGADASAFENQINRNFIYLEHKRNLFPNDNTAWQYALPLNDRNATFARSLLAHQNDEAIVIGYPTFIACGSTDEPAQNIFITPIFYFIIEKFTIEKNILYLKNENPVIQINYKWFDEAFKYKKENKRSFLASCGMLETSNNGNTSESIPTISIIISALESFFQNSIRENLEINHATNSLIKSSFVKSIQKTGIYNKIVLMKAKKTKYTATLCKELAEIAKYEDSELDKTSLKFIFKKEKISEESGLHLNHESIVPEYLSLNNEQRLSVASLLKNNVTVITGPPGTGKSQVVTAAIAASRLCKNSMLFSSRNHKALEAVVGRINEEDDRPLIIRANSNTSNIKFDFQNAIKQLLSEHYDAEANKTLPHKLETIDELLKSRGDYAAIAKKCISLTESLGEIESTNSNLLRQLESEIGKIQPSVFGNLPNKACSRLLFLAKSRLAGSKWNPRIWWYYFLLLIDAKTIKRFLGEHSELSKLLPNSNKTFLESFTRQVSIWEKLLIVSKNQKSLAPLTKALKQLPPFAQVVEVISQITKQLSDITPQTVLLDADSRLGIPPMCDRQALHTLNNAFKANATGLTSEQVRGQTKAALQENLPLLLHRYPCWAVTSLSVGSHIPLYPGMFDLTVIDEAGQADIPSAIPLLFRAKRVGVVGDPWQLPYITKISQARNTLLMKDAKLSLEDMRFSYLGNSLYELVAGANKAQPVLLAETYRSAAEIAEYSSQLFYGGQLRVATDKRNLRVPDGMSVGIHWTDVQGDVVSAGQSGCICQAEIEAIVHLLKTILLENSFKGTLGIVTPFRKQAIRIQDALRESDTNLYQALTNAQCIVDTAHGFQGDERDVMLFSLCAGPNMPPGSLAFIRETGNLFNVAVSRARAVLHIVGNRDWAENCGFPHVRKLVAIPAQAHGMPRSRGEWHPHESPWEKFLFEALVSSGFDPRPQYPAGSRRLDMALIDEERKVFLDIEVDGDCHRMPDGTRKTDDVWRDIQLQGMGWKVLRFWTYQLREDLDSCIKTVAQAWRG